MTALERAFKKQKIGLHLGAKGTRVEETGEGMTLWFEKGGETQSVTGDVILVATGRGAVVDDLGLEQIGVKFTPEGDRDRRHPPHLGAAHLRRRRRGRLLAARAHRVPRGRGRGREHRRPPRRDGGRRAALHLHRSRDRGRRPDRGPGPRAVRRRQRAHRPVPVRGHRARGHVRRPHRLREDDPRDHVRRAARPRGRRHQRHRARQRRRHRHRLRDDHRDGRRLDRRAPDARRGRQGGGAGGARPADPLPAGAEERSPADAGHALPDADAARCAGRRAGDLPPVARPGGLRPPDRRGPVLVPAARLARAPPGRADHPRGDGRDRRAGDADARPASGRALEAHRALRHPRAVQAQGPRGPRPRAVADARGDHRGARRRGDPLVPRRAADLVPHPDQGARRAAPAGRRPAHARVHHEGLVHDRPRPGRARSRLRPARDRVRPHLQPLRHPLLQGRLRRRHDGRLRRARVHGAVARGRGSRRALRRLRLRLQRRDGRVRAAAGDAAAGCAGRGGAHAGRRHHRRAGRVPRHRRGPDREVGHRRARGRAGRGGARRRAGRPPRCTTSSCRRRSVRRTARRSRTRSARRSAPTRARSAPSASPRARCARS